MTTLSYDPESGWYINIEDEGKVVGRLGNTHNPQNCEGRGCAIHNHPSNHPLNTAPLNWREDRGILERICKHGVGHPDYDSAEYLDSVGQSHANIHGCDGCCGISYKKESAVEYLDGLANHFEFRDWDYTRNSNISEIRYKGEHDEYNKLSHRLKQAVYWMFGKTPEWYASLGEKNSISKRLRMALHCLKRDPNLPDGVLDSGNVITFWEETGEYLNLMQPTVGSLLVNFLKEEPEHPHAKLITQELERLFERYKRRITDNDNN